MSRGAAPLALFMLWVVGCGDSQKSGANSEVESDAGPTVPLDAGHGADAGYGADASRAFKKAPGPALRTDATADQAARELCGLLPWVVGKISLDELPMSKVMNQVRDDVETFGDDKPPICIDDKDSGMNLCEEMPEGTTTYTYLYRGENAVATDAVQQVWCKSDNYEDLARIEGVTTTAKGSCADLNELVVSWARAQLTEETKRGIRYEADVLERGSEWIRAKVVTSEEGDTLVAKSPELYADTKEVYIANNGTDALPYLTDAFFGNHYCKVLSPQAVLTWLQGK